ncbi:putative MFS family arabinose efflux permease [Sinobacterium caligoides]|uniref:Putative MFS family arabinose efflux permease n=1 Tax=Sinobacterium caligoides TaxID=933926 RepID=A0A3N2E0Q4_9GAMM|nr:MFS transporter [Sinobacterium caligoides]ROS05482.1 putative MFS family arabinose efflux permease [Sinobacterium caligoides]
MKRIQPLLIGLILIEAIYAFDTMVLAIAMPSVANDLDGQAWYSIGFGVFILASLVGVVWSGSSVDSRGAHYALLRGFACFSLGLIVAALAENFFVFIVARGIQGLGGGVLTTAANALINAAYDREQRPRIIALLNTAWMVPALLAPGVGGFLVEGIGWRYIFWLQLPILLVIGYFFLPLVRQYKPSSSSQVNFSLTPTLQLVFASALILLLLNQAEVSPLLLLLPLAFMLLFKALQRLLPPGTLSAHYGLAASLCGLALTTFVFYLSEIFIPLLLTEAYQLSATSAGFALTMAAVTWPIGGALQAWLIQRYSYRFCVSAGSIAMIGGLFLLLLQAWLGWSHLWIYLAWGYMGACLGQLKAAGRACAMEFTQPGQEGSTASAKGVLDALAGGLAAGVAGMIYNIGQQQQWSLTGSVSLVWLVALSVAFLLLPLAWSRYPKGQRRAVSMLTAEG